MNEILLVVGLCILIIGGSQLSAWYGYYIAEKKSVNGEHYMVLM